MQMHIMASRTFVGSLYITSTWYATTGERLSSYRHRPYGFDAIYGYRLRCPAAIFSLHCPLHGSYNPLVSKFILCENVLNAFRIRRPPRGGSTILMLHFELLHHK